MSLFCQLLITFSRGMMVRECFFAEAFLVEVGKREKCRDEANEGCSAQEEITACFSSLARNC